MAIVSVAIVVSFHLRKTATDRELRMATPLGVIFLSRGSRIELARYIIGYTYPFQFWEQRGLNTDIVRQANA